MQSAYRAIIVSAPLLCNYRLEFNETLWESSISREYALMADFFRTDTLTQTYDP
jgi:hypothetical protein